MSFPPLALCSSCHNRYRLRQPSRPFQFLQCRSPVKCIKEVRLQIKTGTKIMTVKIRLFLTHLSTKSSSVSSFRSREKNTVLADHPAVE